ncbi:MAG: 1-deoxy-D-xylulose-5-phosphate reductoisomerase [bacterium]
MKKRVAVLGSTGSIGEQALEVTRNNKDKFEVIVITANNNYQLLIEQALEFIPNHVVIGNMEKYHEVKDALNSFPIEVHGGNAAIEQVVQLPEIDIVLTAMVGYAGLCPTLKAIETGKDIALANKETLVVAGELIMQLAKKKKVNIIPVDSEHSAIFQCLTGEENNPVEKIYLTASGGPFRGKNKEYLKNVTKEQALDHPNWCMGNKITIDSASLMNKGLEVIEAKWLFHLNPEQIDVIVHPQSIIHSMVQYEDGSIKAQMGLPDMKLPILYALGYPQRIKTNFPRFNFLDYPELTFELPDLNVFKNLAISYEVIKQGGNMPCAMNAANEVVVEAFLNDRISFLDMPEVIIRALNQVNHLKEPKYDDYINTDTETRRYTNSII